jgi:dienelactone hydrolase
MGTNTMAKVAVFHSVLGVRPGVTDAARRLTDAGHDVLVVDQYVGRVFDDYQEADAFAQSVGYPELMSRALEAVRKLDDGFVCLGFSNGGGMAEHVAGRRAVSGAILVSAALPLDMAGVSSWPADVPVQMHYTARDPFRRDDWIHEIRNAVQAAGASFDMFEYGGDGHLFTDRSRPDEYQSDDAELCWKRVLAFAPLNQ